MNHRIVVHASCLGFSLLVSAGAQAQVVSNLCVGHGNDSNPCTLVAPCRLLPAAIAAVINGGEVWMLDSATTTAGP